MKGNPCSRSTIRTGYEGEVFAYGAFDERIKYWTTTHTLAAFHR